MFFAIFRCEQHFTASTTTSILRIQFPFLPTPIPKIPMSEFVAYSEPSTKVDSRLSYRGLSIDRDVFRKLRKPNSTWAHAFQNEEIRDIRNRTHPLAYSPLAS